MSRFLRLVIIVLLIPVSFVTAQDDEQAIIDRVITLIEMTQNYDSFQVQYTLGRREVQDMAFGSVATVGITIVDVDISATVIRGDNPNITGTITAFVERSGVNPPESYWIFADMRFVDEQLYVNILGLNMVEGFLTPNYESGWQVVDETFAFYGDLGLGEFLDSILITERDAELIDAIRMGASDQVAEEIPALEGTQALIVILGGEWAVMWLDNDFVSDNPTQARLNTLILDRLSERDDFLMYGLVADNDDTPLSTSLSINYDLTNIDLGLVDSNLDGARLALTLNEAQGFFYTQINEVFERVGAPE